MIDEKKLKSPFFLFDESKIRENIRRFRDALPYRICYSVKTNNLIEILRIIKSEGCFAEVSGDLDFKLAIEAGFDFNNMVFDSPTKEKEEIITAVEKGVCLNVDSYQELELINNVCKEIDKEAKIYIRLSLKTKDLIRNLFETYAMRFGIQPKGIGEVIRFIKGNELLHLIGLKAHIGSQILSANSYLEEIDQMFRLVEIIRKKYKIDIKAMNFGGGFPSKSLKRSTHLPILKSYSKPPEIEEFGNKINKKLKYWFRRYGDVDVIFEPGRFIVSDSGLLISKVYSIKDNWVFLDASTNWVPESLFFVKRDIIPIKKSKEIKRYNISGNSLDPTDVFGINIKCSKLYVGDLVAIGDAGAYTISKSNQFMKYRPPVYLLTENNELIKIRREDNINDLLSVNLKR